MSDNWRAAAAEDFAGAVAVVVVVEAGLDEEELLIEMGVPPWAGLGADTCPDLHRPPGASTGVVHCLMLPFEPYAQHGMVKLLDKLLPAAFVAIVHG